jgi:hypothetical protein
VLLDGRCFVDSRPVFGRSKIRFMFIVAFKRSADGHLAVFFDKKSS